MNVHCSADRDSRWTSVLRWKTWAGASLQEVRCVSGGWTCFRVRGRWIGRMMFVVSYLPLKLANEFSRRNRGNGLPWIPNSKEIL